MTDRSPGRPEKPTQHAPLLPTWPDLEALHVLVLVARRGSIGSAALSLGLSQPSVSRRMTTLERSAGVPLLRRSTRGTTLTPAGKVVVDWAETLLGAAEEFTRSVGTLRSTRTEAVHAAVSMTIAEHYAPGWLGRLHASAPELRVSLAVHNSTDVADLVESGRADVGFVESPSVRRTLRRRRIAWDRLHVAVAPDHPWVRRRGAVSAAELASSGLLVRERGSGTRETVERALEQAGVRLEPGQVLPSNTALKSAAAAGVGPVALSEVALATEIDAGHLVRVEVSGVGLRRPLWAVWRRDEPVSSGAMTLLRAASGG